MAEDYLGNTVSWCISGKALKAFSSLPTEKSTKYEEVKHAILQRYNVNSETYRLRFRNDFYKQGESHHEYFNRLEEHFQRWTKSQGMELRDLIILEQFLQGVPTDLSVWLKERKPTSAKEAAQMADDYILARGTKPSYEKLHRPQRLQSEPSTKVMQEKQQSSKPFFRVPPPEVRNIPPRSKTNTQGEKQCYNCKKWGHIATVCPQRTSTPSFKADAKPAFVSESRPQRLCNPSNSKYIREGRVEGKDVKMLVDTGSHTTIVKADLVENEKWNEGETINVICVHGDSVDYPTAEVDLEMDGWAKKTKVALVPEVPVDVLIGIKDFDLSEEMSTQPDCAHNLAVMTRSQTRKEAEEQSKVEGADNVRLADKKETVNDVTGQTWKLGNIQKETIKPEEEKPKTENAASDSINPENAGPEMIQRWQSEDPTLEKARALAREPKQQEETKSETTFYYRQGLLYRQWVPKGSDSEDIRSVEQLVLPLQCRSTVLKLAHDVPAAGHLGINKTKDRVLQRYYWPGVFQDVANHCRTCEVCQKAQGKRYGARAEMIPLPLIEKPFQRIAMDIVGPLPRSNNGNRYILTICDYATRYPEAIPIPNTEAITIAKELVSVFARVGIPDEILTDQGSNFMSSLLQEMYLMLNITRLRTSPCHPQTDGLTERFNGTLKSMIRKFAASNQRDWDEHLPYLLFAYREVPQESTGFSPFELLYGRRVRGPLDVLKEAWVGYEVEKENVSVHVLEMRRCLEEMSELVKENATKAQKKQKNYYDKKSRPQNLKVGDEVLILEPARRSKLQLEWNGPYKVTRRVSEVDYEVQTPGRRREKKVYHVNLLKKWQKPQTVEVLTALDHGQQEEICEEENFEEFLLHTEESPDDEVAIKVDINPALNTQQRSALGDLLHEFRDLFGNKLGRTQAFEHSIEIGDATPIRQAPYRIPLSQRQLVKDELDKMLKMGVIRPSTSPWASPVVIVPKKDGGVCFCVDYRKLNRVAKFDAYPMPRIDDVIEKVGKARYISTLDLARGYWQIPMSESSMEKTAFATPFGLYEFVVMPFGLHSAPATFMRMMNHLLSGYKSFVDPYFDDVPVFSEDWEDHLVHLRKVFTCLKDANLSLKSSKCRFGYTQTQHLGHVIGEGKILPDPKKVEAVKNYKKPESKSEVRAFLGLTGYYRRFIPNYSSIAAPLTALTQKVKPENVQWDEENQRAFEKLKNALTSGPVLKAPEVDKPFIVQTDACDLGIGAVLSQLDEDGEERPVAYASRKLLPRETRYSTIEKECLAIVWALKQFRIYLYGMPFVIETDHKPLIWLQKMKDTNQRLTRWAITVQQYQYEIRHRPGVQHGNADGLSRGPL